MNNLSNNPSLFEFLCLFKIILENRISLSHGSCLFQALKGESREQTEDLDALIQKKEAFIVDKLRGLELNLGGVKLKCFAHTDERDNFALLKQSWHKGDETRHTGVSLFFPVV